MVELVTDDADVQFVEYCGTLSKNTSTRNPAFSALPKSAAQVIKDVFEVRKSIFPEGDLDYLGNYRIKQKKGEPKKSKGMIEGAIDTIYGIGESLAE